MKRLLLAPLLLALTSCSNNITIKTNVGEKMIIKESTVIVDKPYRVKDHFAYIKDQTKSIDRLISQTQENIKQMEDEYIDCVIKNETNYCRKFNYPIRITNYEKQIAEYENLKVKSVNRIKKLTPEFRRFNQSEIISTTVKYIPIFEDINGKKFVKDEATLKCFNNLIDFSSIEIFKSDIELNSLEKKICKKYTKF